MILQGFEAGKGQLTAQAIQEAKIFAGNPGILVAGIVLVIAGFIVLFLLKKLLINSLLGMTAWLAIVQGLGINLPFEASLVISAFFGLPGMGALLVLRFMGIL